MMDVMYLLGFSCVGIGSTKIRVPYRAHGTEIR